MVRVDFIGRDKKPVGGINGNSQSSEKYACFGSFESFQLLLTEGLVFLNQFIIWIGW